MSAHSESRRRAVRDLPNLPPGDDDDLYAPPSSLRTTSVTMPDRVRQNQVQVQEVVERPARRTRASRGARLSTPHPVMPSVHAIVSLAFPCTLMAMSIAVVWLLGRFTPFGVPVWAAGVYVPTVLLAWFSGTSVRSPWQRAALINLATMAVVFPVLVIRQSVVRIPFVGNENGTLLPPLIATISVIVLLTAIAIASAILSQEDPEFAGIVFLPAAMMVPLLAGQSNLVSLSSGLLLAMGIFAVAALLTVIASVVPPMVAVAIPPVTIAVEFLVLSAVRSSATFPVGASTMAKVLFFTIVVITVALAILVPFLSTWIRQVTLIARTRPTR